MLAESERLSTEEVVVTLGIDPMPGGSLGVVERLIIRLVALGMSDAEDVARTLSLFSRDVLAKAVTSLVNEQLIVPNVDMRRLRISEGVEAILERCLEFGAEVRISRDLLESLGDAGMIVTRRLPLGDGPGDDAEQRRRAFEKLSREILATLLPEADATNLARFLDFRVYVREVNNG